MWALAKSWTVGVICLRLFSALVAPIEEARNAANQAAMTTGRPATRTKKHLPSWKYGR